MFNAVLMVALGFGAAGVANASLIGANLGVEVRYPDINTVYCCSQTAVVGAGVEFPTGSFGDYNDNVYVDADNLRIEYGQTSGTVYGETTFNGFRFFDALGTFDPIIGVTLSPDTNLAGFDISRVTFDADNIYINLSGLSTSQAHRVVLDLQFGQGSEIPEPSTVALLGLGLAGMGLLAPRLRRSR